VKASDSSISARLVYSPLWKDRESIKQSGEWENPLALPPFSTDVGQFYFGDLPQRWVKIQLALTNPPKPLGKTGSYCG